MANEYVQAAELKATLDLSSETFADADIAVAIEAASRAIDEDRGRRFWLDTGTDNVRFYTPKTWRGLWIDDATQVTEVAVDREADGVFDETWVENVDYVLQPLNAAEDGKPYTRIVARQTGNFRFPWAGYERTVRVTGQFGWPAVPAPIKQATTIIAAKLLRRAREAPFGVVSIGIEGAAMRIARNDPDVQYLLASYQAVGAGV